MEDQETAVAVDNGLDGEAPAANLAGDAEEQDVLTLERLIAGEDPFLSWGYCKLKITQGGKSKFVNIPIKSVGVSETMDRVAKDAPIAPSMIKAIKMNSPEGRALGLRHDKICEVENQRDSKYMGEMHDYNVLSMWRVVLKSLAVDIVTRDGQILVKANDYRNATEVLDEKAAIAALKTAGWSGHHLQQLYQALSRLTSEEEARIDRE